MKKLAALLLPLCACGPTYPSGRVVDRPRPIAVRLDPPEARVGDRVEARTLVAVPEGWEPPIDVALWACPEQGYWGQGCAGEDGAMRFGDDAGSFEVGDEWTSRVEIADPFHVYLVVTAALESGGDSDTAIKRLVLALDDEDEPPNENPTLDALLLGDEEEESGEIVVAAGESVALHPVVAEGSVEPYLLRTLDGDPVETEEEMYVSFYASCGAIGTGLATGEPLASTWTAPDDGACTLWAVLRDGRGGTDWRSRRAAVR